jgi:hypothetical protein
MLKDYYQTLSGNSDKTCCLKPLLCVFLLFIVSCAAENSMVRFKPLLGEWRTERNVIVSIHVSQEYGVAAFIQSAPGFLDTNLKAGKAIITNISPLADGSFSGTFLMPGKEKSFRVKMVFLSPETLLIGSWDKRVKGNIQKWQRGRKHR